MTSKTVPCYVGLVIQFLAFARGEGILDRDDPTLDPSCRELVMKITPR